MPFTPPASVDPRVGSTLNQTYLIERQLGVGGMGVVYEAQHVHLQRPVAVKVLHPQIAEMHIPLERFRREAQITSQLGHPGLVSIIDFNFAEDGAPYMVMELLEGETLAQRLTRGPLDLAETCALFHQLGDALDAVHEAGVVHRDLKPENIFLLAPSPQPPSLHAADPGPVPTGPQPAQVKILDFGVSKIHDAGFGQRNGGNDDLTGHEVLGTPSYLAPEQASGSAHEVDRRADIFALGTMLYECLTGQKAFDGPHAMAILRVMMTQSIPRARDRMPGLPAAIDTVIARACAMEPTARFATVGEMCDALFTAAGLRRPGSELPELPELPEAEASLSSLPTLLPQDSSWGDGDTLFDADVADLRSEVLAAASSPALAPPPAPAPAWTTRPPDEFTVADDSRLTGPAKEPARSAQSPRPLDRVPSVHSDRATAILDTLATPPAGVTRPPHWAQAVEATRDIRSERATGGHGHGQGHAEHRNWLTTLTTALVAVLVGIVVGMLVLKLMSRDEHPSLALERAQQIEQLLSEGERLAAQGRCADALQKAGTVLLLSPTSVRARKLNEACKRASH